jgi:hypothetical protein
VTTSNPAYWPQEVQSDLARIRRDHEFLRVLASAVAAKGLGNPLTDRSLLAAVVGDLEVDSGFSATAMVNLVLTYHAVNVNKAPQLTLPVSVNQSLNYYYQGYDYGSIEFPSQPVDQQVVRQFLALPATVNTATGRPLPAPSSVTVSVMNGTGATNQAADTGAALTALGFHVAGLGDTASVGTQSETVVTYDPKTPGALGAAEAVLQSLSGAVVLAAGQPADGAEVTVTTGSDFSVNPPAPAAPATTAGAAHATAPTTTAPATTTTAPATGGGSFAAPTAPTETLAPWDPRSCTPSGGEGP